MTPVRQNIFKFFREYQPEKELTNKDGFEVVLKSTKYLKENMKPGDIILTIGAGNITHLSDKLE